MVGGWDGGLSGWVWRAEEIFWVAVFEDEDLERGACAREQEEKETFEDGLVGALAWIEAGLESEEDVAEFEDVFVRG